MKTYKSHLLNVLQNTYNLFVCSTYSIKELKQFIKEEKEYKKTKEIIINM